jgi:hypothetical protein
LLLLDLLAHQMGDHERHDSYSPIHVAPFAPGWPEPPAATPRVLHQRPGFK